MRWVNAKRPWRSKTLWFSSLIGAAAAINAQSLYLADARTLSWVAVGVAAFFAWLRTVTKGPVELGD